MAVTISFKQTVEGILARLEACSTPLMQNEIENIIIQEKNMMMVQQIDFANGCCLCSKAKVYRPGNASETRICQWSPDAE